MLLNIYKKAFAALVKSPWKLLGLVWLGNLLITLASGLVMIPVAAIAVNWLISVAITIIMLAGYRNQNVETLMLFDNFKSWPRAKRILCGMGWKALWVFLWGLIPVVGPVIAIIRSYEYRFVPYLLVLHPEIAPKDVLKESAKRTDGYKGKMFWSDVLIGVAFYLVGGILFALSSIKYIGVLFALIAFVVALAYYAFVGVFKGLVDAAWYEEVKNAPARQPKPVCPVCGKEYPEGTRFCPSCGQPLVIPAVNPLEETPEAPIE